MARAFCLHGFDVVGQVHDADADQGGIRARDCGEERSPDRHLRIAVGWFFHTVSQHILDVFVRELSFMTLRERGEVRWRILELGRDRAVALQVISMANSAVALVKLQARNRIGAREVCGFSVLGLGLGLDGRGKTCQRK
ncbi:MAG: hypothetical protein WBS17_10270 [Candidatus Acidiferrales bacterium]